MKSLILCRDIFKKFSAVLAPSMQLLRTVFPLSLVDETPSLSLRLVQKAGINFSLKWKHIDCMYNSSWIVMKTSIK